MARSIIERSAAMISPSPVSPEIRARPTCPLAPVIRMRIGSPPIGWKPLFGFLQEGRARIFLRKQRVLDAPLDAYRRVVPADAELGLAAVGSIAFVKKQRFVRPHQEPMGEATRDPELAIGPGVELNRDVLPVR